MGAIIVGGLSFLWFGLFFLLFGPIAGLVVFVIWWLASIRFIGPAEMAVLVIFGKPVAFHDSGIKLVPLLPYCYLARRPKKLFNLDYPARDVITKEKGRGRTKCGAQILKVDAVAYLSFPQKGKTKEGEGDLVKILQFDVPFEEEKLKTWTEDSVTGALRAVFAEMSWKEAIEKIEGIKKDVEEKFRDADGALVKAGFDPDDLKLTITEINLPPELAKLLPLPDQERLKKDAAKFVAERQATEWVGMVLEASAQSRGKSKKEIQVEIDADKKLQREFLDYFFEMNKRLEEADRRALHHVIVEGGGKSNEEDGGGFIDALVNGIIKVLTVSKMIPEEKGGEEKSLSSEKEKEKKIEGFSSDFKKWKEQTEPLLKKKT